MAHYIQTDKSFDIRTLWVVMSSNDIEIERLIERNTNRFRIRHTAKYAEDTKTLSDLTAEYEDELRKKIETVKLRLASTANGQSVSLSEASAIFKRTIQAVKNELDSTMVNSFFQGELGAKLEDDFGYQKNESLTHLSMFIEQYNSDLDISDEKR